VKILAFFSDNLAIIRKIWYYLVYQNLYFLYGGKKDEKVICTYVISGYVGFLGCLQQ
jgi:hypothetical protein